MSQKCSNNTPTKVSFYITDNKGHTWTSSSSVDTTIKVQDNLTFCIQASAKGNGLVRTVVHIDGAGIQSGSDTAKTNPFCCLEKLNGGQKVKIWATATDSNGTVSTHAIYLKCFALPLLTFSIIDNQGRKWIVDSIHDKNIQLLVGSVCRVQAFAAGPNLIRTVLHVAGANTQTGIDSSQYFSGCLLLDLKNNQNIRIWATALDSNGLVYTRAINIWSYPQTSISFLIADEQGHNWKIGDSNVDTTIYVPMNSICNFMAFVAGYNLISSEVHVEGVTTTAINNNKLLPTGSLAVLNGGMQAKIWVTSLGPNGFYTSRNVYLVSQMLFRYRIFNERTGMGNSIYNPDIALRKYYDFDMKVLNPFIELSWNTGNVNDSVSITPSIPGTGNNLEWSGNVIVEISQATTFHLAINNSNRTQDLAIKYDDAPPVKPFSIYSKGSDPNGFPLNPKWGYQVYPPNRLLAVQSFFPHMNDYTSSSSIFGGGRDGWEHALDPYSDDKIQVDEKQTGNDCESCIPGHYNWKPACVRGNINWESHSTGATIFEFGGDDDYCIKINEKGDTNNLLTTANDKAIEGEFDSDETVDKFGEDKNGTWWQKFRYWVDENNNQATDMMRDKEAICIGLVGLDCNRKHNCSDDDCAEQIAINGALFGILTLGTVTPYHCGIDVPCQTELHPIYALLVHINKDPQNDSWAFFVRNWGDEGYCGNSCWFLDGTPNSDGLLPLLVQINAPDSAADYDYTASSIIHGSSDIKDKSIPSKYFMSSPVLNHQITVSFNLTPCPWGPFNSLPILTSPYDGSWMEGELHIRWKDKNNEPLAKVQNSEDLIVNKTNEIESNEDRDDIIKLPPKIALLYQKKLKELSNAKKAARQINVISSEVLNASKTVIPENFKNINYTVEKVWDSTYHKERMEKVKLLEDIINGKVK